VPSSKSETAFFQLRPLEVFGRDALRAVPELQKSDLSRLNRIIGFLSGELSNAEDRITTLESATAELSSITGGTAIADTHAVRLSTLATASDAGSLFWETDRTVLYQVQYVSGVKKWVYVLGDYRAALASRPTDLATPATTDDGFLFQATDGPAAVLASVPGYTYKWNGATGTWIILEPYSPRVIVEKIAGSASVAQFRANGTVSTPTAVQSGEELGLVSMRGYGTTKYPASSSVRIVAVASETFTDAHGGADLVFYTTPKLTVTPFPRFTITSEGAVGVNITTPTAMMDVVGVLRARSCTWAAPTDGEGIEVNYNSSVGYVDCYDRVGATHKPLRINAIHIILNDSAAGNVLIKTTTNNASGGALQVNGDVTPNTDYNASLGTAGCQWEHLRLHGSLYSQGTAGITHVVPLYKLTSGGTNGSITFVGGIPTAYVDPT
jgi:hypothetical protein